MDKPILLVVDDDAEVLHAAARDLRKQYGDRYRVLRAESAEAALEALDELRERGDPVALVLSDQRMPGMDGVSLLGAVRERFPDARRVLLTAYADTEAAIAAINQSQVDYYLLKPWDPPEEKLFPVLDDLLDDWRARYRPPFEGIRVVGDRWSPRVHEIKDFLARNQVPYRFDDVERSHEARALAEQFNGGASHLPLVLLPGGDPLEAPSTGELAERIGLKTQADQPFYDLAIIGGGPAGLASAVYGASEGLRTVLIEQEAPGGQAGTSSRIENYLGFPAGLSGADLARRAVAQARRFGVEILTPQQATGLALEGSYKRIRLADGSTVACHALMIATGVSWRRLPVDGADALTGRGVYYGAAMTEALSCRDEVVYTVGAGNSAGQAAMHFSEYARRVVMLVRGDALEAGMSQYLVDRIRERPNIEVRLNTEVQSCRGEERLEELTVCDTGTGATEGLGPGSLFVFIGATPHTEWLGHLLARDEHGFLITGQDLDPSRDLRAWPLEREPFMLETCVPGIFVAGDVRHDSVKRVASAVGEGSVAVHFIHRYLATL